jgi:uncharacterized protein YndB with AHSA1/START domain
MSVTECESIRVMRRIAATPERVFRAWVDPEQLRRWLAPVAEADARAGGHFRLAVSAPEGEHVVTGEYLEFVPDQRIAMTWVYEGPMAPEGKMEARLTVEFRGDASHTDLNLHHQHLHNPTYFNTIRNGAWEKALDGLQVLVRDTSM